jgi:hypothetical protein
VQTDDDLYARAADQRGWRIRCISLGSLIGCVLSLAGLVLGTRPLRDNSFLTHLATGRLILDTGGVPSADPYSWTAQGTPWVVQSWLASVVYAVLERIGGLSAIQLWTGAQTALLCLLIWRLTAPVNAVLPRLALAIGGIAAGGGWSERPYLLGLVLFALVLLWLGSERTWWWMLPVGWIWANSHGGWLLAVGVLAVVLLGRRLDGADVNRQLRGLAVLCVGVVAGVVGPLGTRALTFPLTAVTKAGQLSEIREWRAPEFTSLDQRVFLGLFACAVVVLGRKQSWSLALPLAACSLLALTAQRNISVSAVVLVACLAPLIPDVGSIRSDVRRRAHVVAAATLVVVGVLSVAARSAPSFRHDLYPAAIVSLVAEDGVLTSGRLAHPDYVGNYLTARFGPEVRVFTDDRADMYPAAMVDDELTLMRAELGWRRTIDEYGITSLIVAADSALAQVLLEADEWHVTHIDRSWVVAEVRKTA